MERDAKRGCIIFQLRLMNSRGVLAKIFEEREVGGGGGSFYVCL